MARTSSNCEEKLAGRHLVTACDANLITWTTSQSLVESFFVEHEPRWLLQGKWALPMLATLMQNGGHHDRLVMHVAKGWRVLVDLEPYD